MKCLEIVYSIMERDSLAQAMPCPSFADNMDDFCENIGENCSECLDFVIKRLMFGHLKACETCEERFRCCTS